MFAFHLHRSLIILGLLAVLSIAKAQDFTPRLTIVITVDGLCQRDVVRLRPYWSQGGMFLLANEGYHGCVTFPHAVYGGNETLATILTGTLPTKHGYIRDSIFVRETRTVVPRLWDKSVAGIGTDQHLSPDALRCATLTDQLREQEGSRSKIYAIGIHGQTAVLLAGHTANACCWLNERNQQWVASTYYAEGLPNAADAINLKHEPHPANQMVTELALDLQQETKMGLDEVPDLLLLEYNALSNDAVSDRIKTAAHEELYAQLNKDLGELLFTLIDRVGKENIQVLLIGKPHFIEQQSFNIDRAAALTSSYLMALYGQERWIDGGYGNSIYLNHDLIDNKKKSFFEVQRTVSSFLLNFEGVQAAYAYQDAILRPELESSLDKHCAGDIVITLESTWKDQVPTAPIFYLGPKKTKPSHLKAEEVKQLIH